MDRIVNRRKLRQRIRHRIRAKVKGTEARPRLSVYRSLSHIYVQAVDDGSGTTLCAAGSHEPGLKASLGSGGNVAAAREVGKLMAERLKAKAVSEAVFDRGGFKYHGRVKALADAVREAGIKV